MKRANIGNIQGCHTSHLTYIVDDSVQKGDTVKIDGEGV